MSLTSKTNSDSRNSWIVVTLSFIVLVLIYLASSTFERYYFTAPLEMFAGVSLATLVYSPTFFALAYIMRHKNVSQYFVWLVPLSVLFFFGPLTAASNNYFRSLDIPDYLFVGFSEETWKIMPILLLLIFVPSVIKSVRHGVFYGALAGFGFTALEMAAYFALMDYPEAGWSIFFSNSLARATLLGTDLHIVWTAFLGGSIVYGLSSTTRWKQILIPLSAFLLVVLIHGLQDKFGKILAVLPIEMLEPFFRYMGLTEESIAAYVIPIVMYGATVNLLLVNIFILPLLFWMIKHDRAYTHI